MKFDDRYGPWAVITGASSGIGEAIARDLAARGIHLVLVARRLDALTAVADDLAVQTRVISLDLSERGAAERLAEQVGDLDIGLVVAAAGFGVGGPHLDTALERHAAMVDLNCRAVVETVHAFAPGLIARGRGGILLFGSVVGFVGVPWTATYSGTKAFVMNFGEALQVELAPHGIDVGVGAPGPTQTAFMATAGMTAGTAASPRTVARNLLRGLRRRRLVLPDIRAFVIRLALWTAPRWLRVRIMGQVMSSMTAGPPIADRSRPAA